jgi:hypothetical protein
MAACLDKILATIILDPFNFREIGKFL